VEAHVEGRVTRRERARCGVGEHLADGEILEEIAEPRLARRHRSLLRELQAGAVVAWRLLGDDLAADDALALRIVGQRRLTVELPALVELGGDAMAEAVVVGPGQITIELHVQPLLAMASAMATVRRAISACSSSTMRPSTVITPLPRFSSL